MKILLTGHTGFVGSACARSLIGAGHEVVGASRSRSGEPGSAGELRIDLGAEGGLEELDAELHGCKAIVHCAACTSRDDAAEIVRTNCLGTQQLIELAGRASVDRFIFISGVSVVGAPRGAPVDESHPTRPRSAYLASKLFGEHLLDAAGSDLGGISLRLTAPVGSGMPPSRMLRAFVERAVRDEPLRVLGRGSRRQNYVHVEDVGRAVELTLASEATGTLNVGGPASISNLELARLCIAHAGSSSEIAFSGVDPEEGMDWEVSSSSAAREIGYRPRWTVADAVDQLTTDAER